MKVTQDFYALLGIPPGAAAEDIRAAYRQAARRFHPDVNTNPGAVLQFRDITRAYEVLGDERQRAQYDRAIKAAGLPPSYFNLRIIPSKRILKLMPEPQVLYVLVEIEPDEHFAQTYARPAPLNLALVIDRSTSMRGARLDKIKQAVHRIIDSLGPEDKLALVSFSDRADIVFESRPVSEKASLKALASTMQASGGTEIYRGMALGVEQLRRSFDRKHVNHLVLLTDGQTYGDEEKCLALASEIHHEGMSISAIGIGEEWNDVFLDELATQTGGVSQYITSPSGIERFLNKHVRSLGAAFVERLRLSVAPDTGIKIEDAFKLTPTAQPLPINLESMPLGNLEGNKSINVILQLQIPGLDEPGFRTILRIDATGDILREQVDGFKVVSDFAIEVVDQAQTENPPTAILEALGKLTLYRMQAKAQEALARGNYREATRRLENLATRLLENGEEALAHAALAEARRVARTTMLSEEGQKHLKYGTRALLPGGTHDEGTLPISKDHD